MNEHTSTMMLVHTLWNKRGVNMTRQAHGSPDTVLRQRDVIDCDVSPVPFANLPLYDNFIVFISHVKAGQVVGSLLPIVSLLACKTVLRYYL